MIKILLLIQRDKSAHKSLHLLHNLAIPGMIFAQAVSLDVVVLAYGQFELRNHSLTQMSYISCRHLLPSNINVKLNETLKNDLGFLHLGGYVVDAFDGN